MIAISKARTVTDVRKNRAAADVNLLPETLAAPDAAFSALGGRVSLDMV